MRDCYEIIEILSDLGNNQVDEKVRYKLKSLIGKDKDEVKSGLLECINDCHMFYLCNSHAMLAMETMYKYMLGGSKEDFKYKIIPEKVV